MRRRPPISTRTPAVVIEYDSRGKRVSKHFDDAHEGKAFYIRMDRAGRKPRVRAADKSATRERGETTMATKKKTTTKARKASTTTKARKAKATKAKRAGIKLVATDAKEPTSKMKIYSIYKGRKSVEPSQAEEIMSKAKVKSVKVTTVRSWISSWNHGRGLPTR